MGSVYGFSFQISFGVSALGFPFERRCNLSLGLILSKFCLGFDFR